MADPTAGWEDAAVDANDCVKAMRAKVQEITPYYDTILKYVTSLEDPGKKDKYANDPIERHKLVNDVAMAMSAATEVNRQVEGMYARVRDIVNRALKNKANTVTINATDKQYGGCTVNTAKAQEILDEMLDQKNDAETMVDYIYTTYNNIMVPLLPDYLEPTPQLTNMHCVKDQAYYLRKKVYEEIIKPITAKLYEMRKDGESERSWQHRKKMRGLIPYGSDTLQQFTDAMYDALKSGDDIRYGMIADNCYKTLTPEEHKWVVREVDVRYKKDSVNVYNIKDQPTHFVRITTLLCRLLFGYQQRNSVDEYIQDSFRLIDEFDVDDMKLLVAIPETCMFTFPIEQEAMHIHTVTMDIIKHVTNYNQNWEMEAAYAYWLWTYIKGGKYTPMKDQEGKEHPVPKDYQDDVPDYFNSVFKVKYKEIAKVLAHRMYGVNGLLLPSTLDNGKVAVNLMMPWMYKFFGTNGITANGLRDEKITNEYIKTAGTFNDVGVFIEWIHETILWHIPLTVWKAMHSLTQFKKMIGTPLLFVPNNFTLFDKEYEFETSYLTSLNTIYWRYGYINDGAGNNLTVEPAAPSRLNYREQGGLCYLPGIDPVTLNVTRYDTFRVQWNPTYTSEIKYVRSKDPLKDIFTMNVNGIYLFRWPTAQQSFLTQSIGTNLRILDKDYTIPFLGANCPMVPFSDYVYTTLINEYLSSGDSIYPVETGDGSVLVKNTFLFTYADYMSTKYGKGKTFNEIFYNNIINRLLRSHITFPYNNIISTSFINAAHFSWHDIALPKDTNAEEWNKVLLPQYILTKSNNTLEKEKFNKNPDTAQFTASTVPFVTLNKGMPLERVTMRVCNASALPNTTCPP